MNQRLYFYHSEQLTLEIEGAQSLTLLRGADQPLAERRCNNSGAESRLLITDVQKSLLQAHIGQARIAYAYSTYGHDPRSAAAAPRLGFNGEAREQLTGMYLLGQGYRAYGPTLMRFLAPDSLSPFDEGGLNAYGYCTGDPINYSDPTGHNRLMGLLNRMLGRSAPGPKKPIKEVRFALATSEGKLAYSQLNARLHEKKPHTRPTFSSNTFIPFEPPIPTPIQFHPKKHRVILDTYMKHYNRRLNATKYVEYKQRQGTPISPENVERINKIDYFLTRLTEMHNEYMPTMAISAITIRNE
ncbi:MAG: RHS repeat-associated core domain-containing protein [Candidatus Pseudomonas phytovorans]|uniref:RHS repeat-associated core domain-containing protein n=1 Tax=Candidatus Pseudomonas phytovorans TaxID=3121377 RepID=A0AAJ5WJ46_9PSED|nr:RHS repeat-associated core domain-containing protein [Pseudomonas sp.]WEK30719.1 MAG: RHS repeat-associated core domain-containing protein [Pseudomonas sp.]